MRCRMRRSVPSVSVGRAPKTARASGPRLASATLPRELHELLAPLHGRRWIRRVELLAAPRTAALRASGDEERIGVLVLSGVPMHVRVVFDPGADSLRADLVENVLDRARLQVEVATAQAHVRRARRANIDLSMELDAAHAIATHAGEESRVTAERLALAEKRYLEGERVTAASAMFASVAHDIRSPLTALVWNLRVLEETAERKGIAADPHLRELFGDTKLACDLIQGVLEGMRTYASGSGAPQLFDVGHLVSTAVRLFRWHVSQRGVQFVQHVEPGLEAWGAPSEICQVVLNLLANAAEASPRGSTVRLEARRVDGIVRLAVTDEGRGIPPSELERVFEPFHSTKANGLGIGLTVARSMARKHGGDLVACTRDDGLQGACLALRLPIASQP